MKRLDELPRVDVLTLAPDATELVPAAGIFGRALPRIRAEEDVEVEIVDFPFSRSEPDEDGFVVTREVHTRGPRGRYVIDRRLERCILQPRTKRGG